MMVDYLKRLNVAVCEMLRYVPLRGLSVGIYRDRQKPRCVLVKGRRGEYVSKDEIRKACCVCTMGMRGEIFSL